MSVIQLYWSSGKQEWRVLHLVANRITDPMASVMAKDHYPANAVYALTRDAILIAPHGMPWAEGSVLRHSAFLKDAPDLTRASIFCFFLYALSLFAATRGTALQLVNVDRRQVKLWHPSLQALAVAHLYMKSHTVHHNICQSNDWLSII